MQGKQKPKPTSRPNDYLKRDARFTQRLSAEQRKAILGKLYPNNPRKEA